MGPRHPTQHRRHRRWSVGAVLTLALAVGACGGDGEEAAGPSTTPTTESSASTTSTTAGSTTTSDASTTSTTSSEGSGVAADVPAFVVVTPDDARLLSDGEVEEHPVPDGTELIFASDDDGRTAVVQVRLDDAGQRGLPRREIRVLAGGEERTLDLGPSPRLHDVATVGDARSVLATRDLDVEGAESEGRLVLVDLDSGEETEVAGARAPEYEVSWASVTDDLIAITAYADLTERIAFFDRTGAEVALASPTDDLAYAAPPLVVAADLTNDGARLAWAEGPEPGDESQPPDAPWAILLAEPGGPATSRITVPEAGLGDQVTRIDLREQWALVSVAEVDFTEPSETPVATWLFDLSVEGGAPVSVPVVGTATFLR